MTMHKMFYVLAALAVAMAIGVGIGSAIAQPAEPTPTWVTIDAGSELDASAIAAVEEAKAAPADPAKDLEGWAKATYAAVKAGKWLAVAGFVLMGAVLITRRFGGEVWPWLKTDRGGVAATLALSFFGALAHSLAADTGPSWSTLLAALGVAWAASGGWSQIKRLIKPPDKQPELPKATARNVPPPPPRPMSVA